MSPEQKLKRAILERTAEWDGKPIEPPVTDENIDELYDNLVEAQEHWDAMSEVRCSGIETGLPCQSSRHYESEAVAAKMSDGSWVGWTYWYGGGKHGEPEEIDWMEDAYDVECTEKEQMVLVRTFKVPLMDSDGGGK